jgi:probable F420-dependent oxidoreductase
MKIGMWYAGVASYASPEGAGALAAAAEIAGFESLWTGDHIVIPAEHSTPYPYSPTGKMAGGGAVPMAEPLILYAWMAARTQRLRFATGVLVAPQRDPFLLAKQAATLDALSAGRFALGVGAGWLREEFEMVGAEFASRGDRLDEMIAALRVMWRDAKADFDGERLSFRGAQITPRVAGGSLPIIVGGHTERAARRAGRLGDGFFPAKGSREELARLFDCAREAAHAAGRSPEALELTVSDPEAAGEDGAERVEQWAKLGAHRVLINPPTFDPNEIGEALDQIGRRIVDHD